MEYAYATEDMGGPMSKYVYGQGDINIAKAIETTEIGIIGMLDNDGHISNIFSSGDPLVTSIHFEMDGVVTLDYDTIDEIRDLLTTIGAEFNIEICCYNVMLDNGYHHDSKDN